MASMTDTGKAKENTVCTKQSTNPLIAWAKQVHNQKFGYSTFTPPKSFVIPNNIPPGELLKYARCVRM